jgi:hypothetical protein
MKTIKLLSLLIIFSSFTLLQKTEFKIQDFEKMAKMNANDFETYILNKGFEFDKTQNYKSFDVVYYKKKNMTVSKAVTTDSSIMYSAFYETSSNTEYVNFKKQAELLGYKYKSSDKHSIDTDNTQYHIYEKGKIKLNFYTANRKEYLGYCIGIEISEK